MPFKIELLPDEPIFIVHFLNPFDVKTDIPALSQRAAAIYEAADQPMWDVTVATDLQVPFGQMVEGLALIARDDSSAVKHPMAAGWVVVVNQSVIRLGAQALTQAQYGALRLYVAESLDQALEKVRAEINRQQAQAA